MAQIKRQALILGGGRGVGSVAAAVCQDLGYSVLASYRGQKPVQPNASWVAFELFQQNAVDLLGQLVDLSAIDALVFAIGPFFEAPLHKTPDSQWQRIVEGNLLLPGQVVSRVLPGMLTRKFGRIVLFGATGADRIIARELSAAYQAAKTGLAVLVKSLARSYAQDNIVANLINPGYIGQDVADNLPTHLGDGSARPHKIVANPDSRAVDPAKREAQPAEFAELLKLTLDPESNLINGSMLAAGKGL